jgi:thiol-disulfide isomerase/thioredoxin
LSASRGKYVLLDFWETWCGWCIEAFPHLKALDSLYGNLQILGIATENKTGVKRLAEDNHLPYPTLLGDAEVLRRYLVEGRPTYVLIDPQGKIIAYAPGDLDKIKAVLKAASAP